MRRAKGVILFFMSICVFICFSCTFNGGVEGEGRQDHGHREAVRLIGDDGARGLSTGGGGIRNRTDRSLWAQRVAVRRTSQDDDSLVATFKESYICLSYFAAQKSMGNILTHDDGDLEQETYASLEYLDREYQRLQEVVGRGARLCAGADVANVERQYIESLWAAASAGVPDAQSCFVIRGPFFPRSTGIYSSDHWLDMYLEHAPRFADQALARNDPYVAYWALWKYIGSDPVHPSKIDSLAKADPALVRKMARLAMLRALPDKQEDLDNMIRQFDTRQSLSDAQTGFADNWALSTFEQTYSRQPRIDLEDFPTCR